MGSSKPLSISLIKAYLVSLIIILIGLGGGAFYYFNWQKGQVDDLKESAYLYHLPASNFCLKYKDIVGTLEILFVNSQAESNQRSDIQRELTSQANRYIYLLLQTSRHIMDLQSTYQGTEFEETTQRLDRQTHHLQKVWQQSTQRDSLTINSVKTLNVTSTQLYKLHTISYQNLVREAEKIHNRNNYNFLVLANILIVFGFILVYQVIKFVFKLISEKLQTEETIRIRAESLLDETTLKLELILNSAAEGVYGLDTDGNITFVNSAALNILGYINQEMLGKHPHTLIHHYKPDGSDYPVEDCPVHSVFQDGQTHKVSDDIFWRKDGSSIPVEYTSTPIKENGNITGAVLVFRDISERKRAEAEVKSTHQKLLHSEKLSAIGKMSASIAHEFNNPLFGIRNALEEIHEGAQLNSEYQVLLEIGIKECNRIKDLIIKLQDFHRPTTGTFQLVNINDLIKETLFLFKRKFLDQKIKMDLNYTEDLPEISAIQDQIKQVVLNLMQNAVDAIPEEGGRISLSTKKVGSNIEIEIQDTGVGIAPETKSSIFEPFFTTKSAVKGTGLGLSISYGIIKNHDGEIKVKSKPQDGSTFTIILPITRD